MRRTLLCGLALASTLVVVGAVSALPASAARAHSTTRLTAHGQLIKPVLHTNTSQNWFGYQQGLLEKNDTLFHSISGYWTVPKATQHVKGQEEYSADWIGIGGGCDDSSCTVTDNTLIQDGTEQDVAANGKASYSAWWELIPAPSETISMTIKPGDRMYSSIVETPADSEMWTMTLKDITRHETFSQTVPYSSTYSTAEWIEETPLVIGTNAGLAPLPNLTSPKWDEAMDNGASAKLKPSERIDLVDSNSHVIGTPSLLDSDHDGFNECTWATTCLAPKGS
jgi:hypothetical protein